MNFVLGFAATATAQPRPEVIGTSELVLFWASRQADGETRGQALYERQRVFARDTVATADRAALHLQFNDSTELRLGENAVVQLDDFVYRRDSADRLAVSVAKGVARFITGRMQADRIRIVTPVSLIGVRGTDFSVWVEPDGRTTIWVTQGQIEVQPLNGAPETVGAGETVAVATSASPVQRNATRPPPDIGLGPARELR